jgi:hypothetical protein
MVPLAGTIVTTASGVRIAPQAWHDVALSTRSAEQVGQVTIGRAAL